jgi:Cation/multidrug efflux pump
MTIPPSFRKVNPADFPVLFVVLRSATLPLSTVHEYGDITIGQTLSQIPGVAQVNIYGAQKFAIRVQADPQAAAARGLSLEDIRAAVARANSSTPVGTLNGPKQDVALQAPARWTRRPTTIRSWWHGTRFAGQARRGRADLRQRGK